MNIRRPSLTSLVAFFLLVPFVYVLSYAPVFQFADDETSFSYPPRQGWQELYRPVEWLTDNTPLREPLLSWAKFWGEEVEDDFRYRSDLRMQGGARTGGIGGDDFGDGGDSGGGLF